MVVYVYVKSSKMIKLVYIFKNFLLLFRPQRHQKPGSSVAEWRLLFSFFKLLIKSINWQSCLSYRHKLLCIHCIRVPMRVIEHLSTFKITFALFGFLSIVILVNKGRSAKRNENSNNETYHPMLLVISHICWA